MQTPLISVIVPCYNIEQKCGVFFDSLSQQTYTHLQLIFVNDGSKDKTEELLSSRQAEFEAKGFQFEVYTKPNGGVSAAMNEGLKHVKGELLCWIDPDDGFVSDYFERRVNYMLSTPDCQILICDGCELRPGSDDRSKKFSRFFVHTPEPKQFEWLLKYESAFCPGLFMARTEAFRAVNPPMEIFDSRRGQNWQMLLPLYYAYDRHYLDEDLFTYYIYDNSLEHSRPKGYEARQNTLTMDEEILIETVKRMLMPENEREKYLEFIRTQTVRLRMYAARSYNMKDDFKRFYAVLKKHKALSFKDVLRNYRYLILKK